MSLIQRQSVLVEEIKAVYRAQFKNGWLGGHLIAIRSKAKSKHYAEMLEMGYTKAEARQSVQDCDQVAWNEASCESVEQQMGVAA